MYPEEIPYTPWSPIEDDAMFTDQEVVIDQISRIIRRPPTQRCSCAIIGGPGMGKTSILKCSKRTLLREFSQAADSGRPRLVPVYLELEAPQDGDSSPLRTLFKQMIEVIKLETMACMMEHINLRFRLPFHTRLARTVRPTTEREDRADFAADLWDVVKVVEEEIGDARLVLLTDNLHRLASHQDLCTSLAESLVELLGPGRAGLDLRPYVCFVLACTDNLTEQLPVRRTDPLINVMEQIRLRPLESEASLQIVQGPLEERLGTPLIPEAADEVHRQTGGHPRLLHLLMYEICEGCDDLQMVAPPQVQEMAFSIAAGNSDIAQQILQFIEAKPVAKPVFDMLRRHAEPLGFQDIRRALSSSYPNALFQLDSALQTLEFLGVITVQGAALAREYRISGEVFKSWFMVLSKWAITEDLHWRHLSNHVENELGYLLTQESVQQDQSLFEELQGMLAEVRTNKALLASLEEIDPEGENPIHEQRRKRYIWEIQNIAIRLETELRSELAV